MSYITYKLIHLLGIFSMVVGLAGLAAHAAAGHSKEENKNHRVLLFLHGFGALVALTGGFGLLARLELESGGMFPGWLWAKLGLWVVLGGLVAFPYRRRKLARWLLLLLPLLAFLGAYLANYKPF
ncbi:MAG: hypothetical protein HKO65_11500 [Gemmatimonadetes bacterium]|nr:hypothetical protein [Gemmatimonadota bacterium]NNM05702.1 hypothetical protein [Gemmatimonadota bacterium]